MDGDAPSLGAMMEQREPSNWASALEGSPQRVELYHSRPHFIGQHKSHGQAQLQGAWGRAVLIRREGGIFSNTETSGSTPRSSEPRVHVLGQDVLAILPGLFR